MLIFFPWIAINIKVIIVCIRTDFEDEQDNANGITRNKRGITCGVGARRLMRTYNQRLPLEFDFKSKRVISDGDSAFVHECGYIVRKSCSFRFKDWRLVPNDVRLPLRHKLTVGPFTLKSNHFLTSTITDTILLCFFFVADTF